ncbi:MAG: FKBP-type peptidyl-prolyl cis-trans isomerase [Bacteroidaceae bacterium]|nr:FKBP-type peptidyl-prolyl cis-trans isomerase [Bacteroidaceae bacterium]
MSEGEQTVNSISMELFGESSDLSLNRDNYLNGFVDGTNLNDKIMSREVASETAERLFDEIHAESMELEYGDNKAAGQIFLEEKAKEEGIIATGSGLLYKVIKKGKGKIPTIDQRVTVKYKGSLIDGTVFDESTTGIELSVGNVIEGWQEALQMMPVGSKWELYIPYELGYGERAAGADIKPYSALIFEVELVSIL